MTSWLRVPRKEKTNVAGTCRAPHPACAREVHLEATQHRKPHYAGNHAATAQPLDRSLDVLTAQHSTHVALGATPQGVMKQHV